MITCRQFRRTLGSIVAAAGILFAADGRAQDKTMPVGIDVVAITPMVQTVPVLGRLVAARTGVVAARIGGAVAEYRVQVGDRVNKGDIIAALVKDRLTSQQALAQAELAQAAAAVETSRTMVQLRRQELKRLEKLRKSAAFSQARLDDKRREVEQALSAQAEARAAQGRARAALELTRIDLANADIRAPYAGVVSKRHTEEGAYVATGDPIVSLIDDENLEIEADVPAERTGGLLEGTVVTFTFAGLNEEARAIVRATVPEENPLTRTRLVRFTPGFHNPLPVQNLAAGQSVTLNLPAGNARDVLSVHKDAVLVRKGKNIVYLVQDGKANVRPVKLGEAVGQRFEVISGLAEGDEVVVRGNERLRPGQDVSTGAPKS